MICALPLSLNMAKSALLWDVSKKGVCLLLYLIPAMSITVADASQLGSQKSPYRIVPWTALKKTAPNNGSRPVLPYTWTATATHYSPAQGGHAICGSELWSAKHDKSQSLRFPIAGPRVSFSIPRFACSSIRFKISSPRFPISSSRFPISSPRFPISSPLFSISSPRFSISRSSKRLCHRRYRFHSATSGYYSWILFSEILIVTTW